MSRAAFYWILGISSLLIGIAGIATINNGVWIVNRHYDVGISASGWLLTLFGFGITIWQLRQAKSSAEAAEKAVSGFERNVKRYDTVVEVTRAQSALANVTELHRQRRWASVHDRYQDAKHAFATIRSFYDQLTKEQRDVLDTSIERLTSMDSAVERFLHENGSEPNVAEFNIVINEIVDNLHDVSLDVRREIGT